MPQWEHKSNYSDIQALQRDGWWPDKTVPAWAEERAAHYQTSPTAAVVLESAYVEEIERLNNVVEQIRPACEYLEIALRYIAQDCIQDPETAQYADRVVDGLSDFGDLFRSPPITIWLSSKIADYNGCFRDIFKTLERFVDEKTLDEMSWRPSNSEQTLIDVSPLLKEHAKIDDCIRLVVSHWEERSCNADMFRR